MWMIQIFGRLQLLLAVDLADQGHALNITVISHLGLVDTNLKAKRSGLPRRRLFLFDLMEVLHQEMHREAPRVKIPRRDSIK
jgi:hypothetical protein